MESRADEELIKNQKIEQRALHSLTATRDHPPNHDIRREAPDINGRLRITKIILISESHQDNG